MVSFISQDRSLPVLMPSTMGLADALAIEAGTPPLGLMDRAAAAVVRVVRAGYPRCPVSILCGPGQNGGDGWVIAWMLRRVGWTIRVFSDTRPEDLTDAAAQAAVRTGGQPEPLAAFDPTHAGLIIDALFGAGLARDIEGGARAAIELAAASARPIVAVDLPSGIDGTSGQVRGAAARADDTVTFHRPKPGHLLQPGRSLCGRLHIADIGLHDDGPPDALTNVPGAWHLPQLSAETHKYARGSVVVASGGPHTSGAARLTARAAARTGAGAVTLACPPDAVAVNANHADAIMVRPVASADEMVALVGHHGSTAVLGPGMGRDERTRACVIAVLEGRGPCVLDADALTVFEDDPNTLFESLHDACVLTPHEGEFGRLFGDVAGGKLERAQQAADRAGCTLLLKGADTVIASPGRVPVITFHGPPWLATAGSGDSLAGAIAALLAQGMDAHDGAAAGAWLHAEAGRLGGPSMTADDLADLIGRAFAEAVLDSEHRSD